MLPPVLLRRYWADCGAVDAAQFCADRQVCRQPAVPHQSQFAQCYQHPPARIPFIGVQSEFRRPRESMMIVVPRFAHRQQRRPFDIAALHCGAIDDMVHTAMVVREMADQPMPGNSRRYARAPAPDDKCSATSQIQ
jgi:hypothetical protein